MSIEAMKQALEALEDANEMAYTEFSSENLYGDAITALRQAIADLEKQKPLAKISIEGVLGVHFTDINRACKLPIGTPLYTHPPKREWQGLTDELMYQLANQVGFDAELMQRNHDKGFPSIAEHFARAIESKLKEKNT